MVKKTRRVIITLFSIIVGITISFFGTSYLHFIVSKKIGDNAYCSCYDDTIGYNRFNEIAEVEQNIFKVYSEDEINENGDLDSVNLYYFPNREHSLSKYAIICPGGAYTGVCKEGEGYVPATYFNDRGITAFVLEYRVGKAANGRKPLEDLARAIQFINNNSSTFNVLTDDYSLVGFSAGGNLIGLFGTTKYGYSNYDNVSKPGCLIMGYPWLNLNTATWNIFQYFNAKGLDDCGYNSFLGPNASKKDREEMHVPYMVDENYPRTFIMHGAVDLLVPCQTNSDIMVRKLRKNNIDYSYLRAQHIPHGIGAGIGTEVDGWLYKGIDFWNK